MDIKSVYEFVVLAEQGSFTLAADELYISQSSLTKHIKSLEAELGVPLFDRSTRKVQLSRFGRAFLPYAKKLSDTEKEAHEELARLSRISNNTCRLAVLPAFLAYGTSDYMMEFKRSYPSYSLTIQEGTPDDVTHWVANGACDMGITRYYEDAPDPQFGLVPLMEDHLSVVIPFGHPLDDGRTSVRFEDLKDFDLVTSTSPLQARVLGKLQAETGITLNITARLGRAEHIIHLLDQMTHTAILLRTATEFLYKDKVRILDLVPTESSKVVLIYLKDEPLNAASKAFLKIAQSHTQQTGG